MLFVILCYYFFSQRICWWFLKDFERKKDISFQMGSIWMYGWFSESISWFICNTWLCVCKLLGNDHHMSADNSVHYHPATFPSKNLHLHKIVYIFRSRYSFYWKDVQKLKVATARGQFLLEIWVVKVKATPDKRFLKNLILWPNKTVGSKSS